MKDLPSGWEKVKLGATIECLDNERVPLNSEQRSKMQGDLPYYGANSQLDSINQFIFNEELLLLAEDGGSWGKKEKCTFIIRGKSWVNNHAHVLRMKKSIDITYLMHFLNFSDLNKYITGSTRGKLNRKSMEKIEVILPPLPTQKKIAAILEKAERLKEWRKEADRLTDEFLKSTFLEIFGDPVKNPKKWETINLKKISAKFSDGPFGSNLKTEHYNNDGIRVIRLQNIGINKFLDEDRAYISEIHFSKLKKHTCLPGDVIIGTMGSPNIRACMIPKSIEIALNKADCIQCRPDKNLATSEYICHLLNLPSTLQMASKLFHGQTRSRISMGNLSSFSIPLPPLKIQNQFAELVQQIEFLQENQSQSKQNIDDLFNALMQQAFKGELAC